MKLSPEDIQLRAARNDDLAAVTAQLRDSTSGVLHALLGQSGVRERLQQRETATGLRSCSVAESVNKVVGHEISYDSDIAARETFPAVIAETKKDLLSKFRQLRRDSSWYLSSLAVLPEFRGCGLGLRLLSVAATRAAAAGLNELSLHVFEEKRSAIRLYSFVGLSEVGRTKLSRHPEITAESDLLLMVGSINRILDRIASRKT